jgi:hypothetical protein
VRFGGGPDEEEIVELACSAKANPVAPTLCCMELRNMTLRKSVKSMIIKNLHP